MERPVLPGAGRSFFASAFRFHLIARIEKPDPQEGRASGAQRLGDGTQRYAHARLGGRTTVSLWRPWATDIELAGEQLCEEIHRESCAVLLWHRGHLGGEVVQALPPHLGGVRRSLLPCLPPHREGAQQHLSDVRVLFGRLVLGR